MQLKLVTEKGRPVEKNVDKDCQLLYNFPHKKEDAIRQKKELTAMSGYCYAFDRQTDRQIR